MLSLLIELNRHSGALRTLDPINQNALNGQVADFMSFFASSGV